MKLRYLNVALVLMVLSFLFGCGSGFYDIEKGDYKDTTQYKSTGAKLKNAYRIQSPPFFTLQLSAGFNIGMSELSSNYENIFDSTQFSQGLNFGVKNGFGFMAIGKIPLHKKGNIRLNVSAGFNRFESNFLERESPYGSVSYNVYTFGAGLENSFNPSFRLKPYIAGEMQANIIHGTANINDAAANTTRVVTFKNSFRIGFNVYGGLEYMFTKKFGMNFGLKFTNSNQILKQTELSDDPNVVPLRDKKEKTDAEKIEFGGFKNFIFTSIYFGVNFYFGVTDIIYRFNK